MAKTNPILGVVTGYFTGVGTDDHMERLAMRIPALQKRYLDNWQIYPSPSPKGIPLDDLLEYTGEATIAVVGFYKRNYTLGLFGLAMLVGSYINSVKPIIRGEVAELRIKEIDSSPDIY